MGEGPRHAYIPNPPSDPVVRPYHYTLWAVEPIYFIMKNNLPYWMGNIIKYVMRHEHKNGVEDLKKARRFLDIQIAKMEGKEDFAEWVSLSCKR